MRVLMEIGRLDGRYEGSLTRVSDGLRLDFCGVLDLVAALESMTPEPIDLPAPPSTDRSPGGAP